ncbi:wyosine [tRNA(Phe)-imidazoG37] synthetase (radical SAM superfamily) [Trichococcus patagoniensis]|uniref:Wyosine [tRNA(Phe)-imidazoG37] synthetase (Radical SAM superfamily) n=1 Tax=Trichococcus patagoniensis TaxID=382641 RepID=A0A2T5IKY2_9LACT|nr:radical SAM protein [Trichococcus patagoniensis]PTQ84484.1 wyosine [tRNA(Phe)-imidazoG37] synthetase (radical SAM superfamily) [Trichococcus patagoniensis]
MADMKYIYGPVPSRRLGISLGVSPIPKKTCNYSCIYCQLGKTDHFMNTREMFFPVAEILDEFDTFLKSAVPFDVVTIVGEGEPTLYLGLGELMLGIKERTEKPIAVITNGALLYDPELRAELQAADIVLPTLDAYDAASFRRINRPHRTIDFDQVNDGLITFSKEYSGALWIEIMLVDGINDDDESLSKYAEALKKIKYDRVYINTPVRPPAEAYAKAISPERMNRAVDILGGIPINFLDTEGFHSEIPDDYAAIMSIIKRHPMNQFEVEGFLNSRNCKENEAIFARLKADEKVYAIDYKGIVTYRLS